MITRTLRYTGHLVMGSLFHFQKVIPKSCLAKTIIQ